MKIKELREKSSGECEKLIIELQSKARTLRFDIASREAKNHREYRKLKKDVARLFTLQQENHMLKGIKRQSALQKEKEILVERLKRV